jgi:hypothetical protein
MKKPYQIEAQRGCEAARLGIDLLSRMLLRSLRQRSNAGTVTEDIPMEDIPNAEGWRNKTNSLLNTVHLHQGVSRHNPTGAGDRMSASVSAARWIAGT